MAYRLAILGNCGLLLCRVDGRPKAKYSKPLREARECSLEGAQLRLAFFLYWALDPEFRIYRG